MRLVSDNSERMDLLKGLLQIAFWDTVAAPLPDDMRALLLSMDLDTIEQDMEDAHKLMVRTPAELRSVA